MKIKTEFFREKLIVLESNLKASKNGAAENIRTLLNRLQSDPDPKEIDQILHQFKSSAKMIEYANFNAEQEQLWMDAWKEASLLLEGKTH